MNEAQGQRRFSRVDFRVAAAVEVGGRRLEGKVENLSLRGMFMATGQKPAIGDAAEITIGLAGEARPGAEDGHMIHVGGKVARVTDAGIAFSFDTIDSDSYVHLRNIIALNSGDMEKTDKEMDAFLGGSPLLS